MGFLEEARWRSRALDVEPITPAVGAIVNGLDLRALDTEAVEAVRGAVLEHGAIFFSAARNSRATRRWSS